jgi:hypothetical protein
MMLRWEVRDLILRRVDKCMLKKTRQGGGLGWGAYELAGARRKSSYVISIYSEELQLTYDHTSPLNHFRAGCNTV